MYFRAQKHFSRCKCFQAPITKNTSKSLDINNTNFLSVYVMECERERERICVSIADRIGLFIPCCCSSLIHFSFSDHIPHPHPYTHHRPTSASAFPIEVGCLQHFCSLHCLLTLKQRDLAFFCIAIFT